MERCRLRREDKMDNLVGYTSEKIYDVPVEWAKRA